MTRIHPPLSADHFRRATTIRALRALDDHPTESTRNKLPRNAKRRPDAAAGYLEEQVPTPSPRQAEETGKRTATRPILVVDDDRWILATIREFLEFEGYTVEVARNGAEALDIIGRSQPSLVLLDMRMPVLDGWGFARELRARGIRLRVVVITAAQSARSWANEIDADGYLAKPFDLIDLLSIVERYSQDPPPTTSC